MTYLYFHDPKNNGWSVALAGPGRDPEVLETYPHARQARARTQELRSALAEGAQAPQVSDQTFA